MGWKSFTEEEILELRSNKYTHTVSASSISFTAEFKEKFWAMYKTGYKQSKFLSSLVTIPIYLGITASVGSEHISGNRRFPQKAFIQGAENLFPNALSRNMPKCHPAGL